MFPVAIEITMPNARTSNDGRSMGLVLAALAAIGWGAAFYALSDNMETRASMSQTISALEAENARLSALVEAKGRLDAVEAQIRKAREELVATLDRRRDLEENIAALHTDLVALDGTPVLAATGPVPDGDETQARASSLNAALVRLDRTIADRSRELARINQAQQESESRLSAASEAADEIERRLAARTDELNAAEQRLSALLADNARLDQLNDRRAAEVQALGEREAAAREEVSTARAEAEALAQRRSELAGEVAALEASIAADEATRAEITENEERLASLREEAAREDERLGQSRGQFARLQAEIETAQAELRRLQAAAQAVSRARAPAESRPAVERRPQVEDRPDGSRVIRITPSLN
jgi:chromosome segregation ATPase